MLEAQISNFKNSVYNSLFLVRSSSYSIHNPNGLFSKFVILASVASNHCKHDSVFIDGINGSITNIRQTIQTLSHQVYSNNSHPVSGLIAVIIIRLTSLTGDSYPLVGNSLPGLSLMMPAPSFPT